MSAHLYPTTCANPACGRELEQGEGVLLLTGSWSFRYCNSACGDEGYRIHNAVIPLAGSIAAASNAARVHLLADLTDALPDGIAGGINWADGSVEVYRDE